jgi:hypothetical protein
MIKTILVLSLFLGIIFIVISLVKVTAQCPKQQIIYRYIPRSFDEEQEEPVYVTDIFKNMFTQPSTWIGETTDLDTRKREQINKFFISQM